MKIIISICAATLVALGASAQEKQLAKAERRESYAVCASDYPTLAKAQRLEGKVVCRVIFDGEGNVKFAEVLKPYNPILDKKALEIALNKSMMFNFKRVSPEVILAVSFKLRH